jgi:heterotetrameric sarcosine oxidase gamma subunit
MAQPDPEQQPTAGPTPLQQAGVEADAVSAAELSMRELSEPVVLRLHSLERPEALAAALDAEGIELPLETNAAAGQDPSVLCLRPGEWLLMTEGGPADALAGRVGRRLNPSLTTLLDLSDGLGVFRLTGASAPWLLAKVSGLDFLAGIRTGQHGARTRVGEIAVVLHFRPGPDGAPCFDLVFDRSVAKYLWDLLSDAAPHAGELYAAHGAAA